jgi:hypothetical protein
MQRYRVICSTCGNHPSQVAGGGGGCEPSCDEPSCDEPSCDEPSCDEPSCDARSLRQKERLLNPTLFPTHTTGTTETEAGAKGECGGCCMRWGEGFVDHHQRAAR